jgi:uncharacterized protein
MIEQTKVIYDEYSVSRIQAEFMQRVYAWMVAGLMVTGITAWFCYDSGLFMELIQNRFLFFLLIISEFIMVMVLSARIGTLSKTVAGGLFLVYSLLNGLTFSFIFVAYAHDTIQEVFFISAAMFGVLSGYGYFTKRSLSGWRSFLMMGLIGIVIAFFVNMFLGSSMLHFVISVVGVVVFAGLTAYDTNKLKAMSVDISEDGEMSYKGAIIGALTLYLDFVNLFLMLLRIFGSKR